MDKNKDGMPYIIVIAPELVSALGEHNDFVVCRYKEENESILLNAKKGEPATVLGVCAGREDSPFGRHVVLEGCGTARSEFWEKLPAYLEANKERLAEEAKLDAEKAEKQLAKTLADDEVKASVSLARAKRKYATGDTNGARIDLDWIFKKYPNTKAAPAARKLMTKIDPKAAKMNRFGSSSSKKRAAATRKRIDEATRGNKVGK